MQRIKHTMNIENKVLKELNSLNVNKKIKIRYRKIGNGNYSMYLDLFHNNQRKREFLKIYLEGTKKSYHKDKEKVIYIQALRDQKEIELRQKNNNFALVNNSSKILFLDYFEAKAKIKNRKWNTTIKHFKEYCETIYHKNITFDSINRNFCENFAEYLKSKLAPKTARGYFIVFKAVLNCAVQEEIIPHHPAQGISIRAEAGKREFLTYEELKVLMKTDCQNIHAKNSFLFSCFTGLRASDLDALKFSDIADNKIILKQQKTKEIVSIPLHPNAKKILEEQRKIMRTDNVFKGVKSSWTNLIIANWVLKAGINKHVTLHIARHTYATLLLTYNVDIFTVSKLLGHTDVKTTQVYAKLVDKKKDEAIEKLPTI